MSEFKLCELCAKQDCSNKGYNPIMCGMFKIKCCANCNNYRGGSCSENDENGDKEKKEYAYGPRDVEDGDYCSGGGEAKEE